MQEMNKKLNSIELMQKERENKTVEEIASIRTEIIANNEKMQETIQKNIISQIRPEIAQIQENLVRTDVQKIVEEVLADKNDVTIQEGASCDSESDVNDENG